MNQPFKKQNKTHSTGHQPNKILKTPSQFLRSYSQLLNRHFTQSTIQKSQLRKNTPYNLKMRPKTQSQKQQKLKKTHSIKKIPQQTHHLFSDSFTKKTSQIKTNSIENTTKTSFNSSKIKLNPQTSDKIQKILASKTSQIQKNSYQNVLLNKKLYETTVQKRDLTNLIETLKLQILKEKKNKSKVSTKMAKLMNKIQQTNSIKNKVESQRKNIDEQTQTINKDIAIIKEKNKQLQLLSENNQMKISIEKELIKQLERKIQITKNSLNETKTHFNQLKSIYQQETKSLSNTKSNFQQIFAERQKFFHTVQHSVTNINTNKKS